MDRTSGWFPRVRQALPALALGLLALVVGCRDDASPARVTGPATEALAVSGAPNQQDWRHCKNDKDPASACDWITGNLNETHNLYYEGWYVPHALRLPHITGPSTDTLVMTFGFKKGGHHTFDFLGVWNASLPNANVCTASDYAEFCTGPVNPTTPPAMRAISASTPAGTLAAALVAATSSACGATVGDSLATAIARAEASGPAIALRGIDLSAIGILDASLDGCGADVEATIRILVTPAPSVTSALLLVGAHIARTRDWMGGGATMVPGAPYHLGLVSINGISTGSMDLQMQSNAIQPMGRVVFIKRTVGDVGSFDFTRTDGADPNPIPATFTMSTGTPGSAASGADTLIYEDVPIGTQVITESTPPAGWALTALSCADPTENSSVSLASRAATIVVDDAEEIVCTFTNTARGAIRVVKTAVGGDSTFAFTPTGFGSGAFSLTTVSGSADTTFANLLPALADGGTYRLSEAALAGWTAGTLACLREDGTTSAGDPATGILVAAGETTTCAITNTKWGMLVVKKVMVGGTGSFTFFEDVSGTISTNNGTLSQAVAPGTYHVTEDTLAGWYLTAIACDGMGSSGDLASRRATYVVAAGQTVTCTFTNTRPMGGPTRTLGFWAQHQDLVQAFIYGPSGTPPAGYTLAIPVSVLLPASVTQCADPADRYWNSAYYLGGLNANVAQTSTKARRSPLDQARIQLMRQLLAAVLNSVAFGTIPSGAGAYSTAFAAYCGTDREAILSAASALAQFNEGGDLLPWTIGPQGPARNKIVTPAMIALWDVMP